MLTRKFFGATPVLCALAWLSVVSLIVGWIGFPMATQFGAQLFFHGHILAFAAAIASFCPLGGLIAIIVVLEVLVLPILG